MPWDLDSRIAGDFRYFDGVEQITHQPRNPPGPDAVVNGHKGAATKEQLASFGGTLTLENITCIWEVWGVADGKVNNGDFLVAANGQRFLVVGRFYSPRTSRHECACQQVFGAQ